MGFLNVNFKRKSPFPRALTSPAKKIRKPLASPRELLNPINDSLRPVERLSSDVLKLVLVYSGNLRFPQVSMMIAAKLRRCRHLEVALVRAQINDHVLKISPAVKWSFVDEELLTALQVNHFCTDNSGDPYVPAVLEAHLDDQSVLAKIAYMVSRKCRVENSQKVYKALAANGFWSAVEAMASTHHRANAEVVVLALQADQGAELAITLLKLSRNLQDNVGELWAIQQAALRASVPEVNSYVITGCY